MMHVFPKNAWEPPNIHEINIHFGAGKQGILKCIQILKDVSCNKCIVFFMNPAFFWDPYWEGSKLQSKSMGNFDGFPL